MNETELAEQFNKKLDDILAGGEGASFSPDPGALELAAALSRADFSSDSAIRGPLRERLAGGAEVPGLFWQLLRGLLRNVYARSALAAACLLLVLLPLVRRSPGPVTGPAGLLSEPLRPAAVLTVLPALPPARAGKPAVRAAGYPLPRVNPDPGIFSSLPMPRLAGEPLPDFPIESSGKGNPEMILAAVSEVRLENGSDLVWETERAVFTIERRVISPEELFQRRSL